MGLLDRFKKAPGPDALTWEAVARARAVAGVAGAEAVDADTVHVSWHEHPRTTVLDLGEVRERWTRANGFDRIELMDEVIAGLAPPLDGLGLATGEVDAPAAEAASPHGAIPPGDATRLLLAVDVRRAGEGDGDVRWAIVDGLDAVATSGGEAVRHADLDAWQVDAEAARDAARHRLASTDPALDPIGPGTPAWVPASDLVPPPAWLAVPARLLDACGLDEVVALAPLPTELVVVDPAATEVLASVLSSTAGIVESADGVLLGTPLLVRRDGVDAWQPPAEHPCAALVERLRATR